MSLCLRFQPLFTLRDTGGWSNSMLVKGRSKSASGLRYEIAETGLE